MTRYMKRLNVAVDLGATSGRLMVCDSQKPEMAMTEAARFTDPMVERGGKWFWEIDRIFESVCSALADIVRGGDRIESIGVDTWGVDVAFLDKDGKLLALPRAYRDPYTEGVPERYFSECFPRGEVYRRTGIQVLDFNTLYQLYACRLENYEPFTNACKILFIPDYITYLLTGKMVTEQTILSTSSFMDPRTKTIDDELLKPCGVSSRNFAPIVPPGTVVGTLRKGLLDKYLENAGRDDDLSSSLGNIRVIAVAGHDTASAVAAVPNDRPGYAYLSSGTWSLMGIVSPEPIITKLSEELNFTNEGGIDGTTRFLKNITGMWIIEQCRKQWKERGEELTWSEIQAALSFGENVDAGSNACSCSNAKNCSEVPSDGCISQCGALIDPDDPSFANPKDMEGAIADFLAGNGGKMPETKLGIVRLVFESLAARYSEVFGWLRGFAPYELKGLYVIGGGSKNAVLNAYTRAALGVDVVPCLPEATAVGNLKVQRRALAAASL